MSNAILREWDNDSSVSDEVIFQKWIQMPVHTNRCRLLQGLSPFAAFVLHLLHAESLCHRIELAWRCIPHEYCQQVTMTCIATPEAATHDRLASEKGAWHTAKLGHSKSLL